MKAKIITGLFLLTLVILINSCENKTTPLPMSTGCPNASDTVGLTYSSGSATMQGIINTYCAISGCHVNRGAGPDYTSYANLSTYATGGQNSNFWQYLFVLKSMPQSPQPPLSICTQNQFKAWLNAGAPQ